MTPKSYFYQLLKMSSVPSLMFLLETHFHSVIMCPMMHVPYSCRKISQSNIRKGNTLFLRKEKKIKASILLPNYITFLNLFSYNTHTHRHKHTQARDIF